MGKSGSTRTIGGYEGAMTTSTLATSGFGVFAYYTGGTAYNAYRTQNAVAGHYPNFMYNEKIYSSDGGTTWKYDLTKYWPNQMNNGNVDRQTMNNPGDPEATATTNNGNVSFFAYAPYVITATENDATITNELNTPTTEGIVGVSGNQYNGTSSTKYSDPYITYVVPASGADIVDLLWGTTSTNSVNVIGSTQPGSINTTLDATGPTPTTGSYYVNTDLTKQITNGTVGFAFKHALSKIGGYSGTSNAGLTVMLDVDNSGAVSGGSTTTSETKVTIKEISIVARSLALAADGTTWKYLTANKGILNLATGKWDIITKVSADDDQLTTTQGSGASTTYVIDQDGSGTNVAAQLNNAIVEPTSWSAWSSYTWDWSGSGATEQEGVTTTAKNVYKSDAEAYPLLFIPGTRPELTITIDYLVRTADTKLGTGYSQVEQIITKQLTFQDPVELNRQYNICMHLGLTSMKFTASVSDWDATYDGTNIAIEEIDLPRNVAATTVTSITSTPSSFSFTSAASQTVTAVSATITASDGTTTNATTLGDFTYTSSNTSIFTVAGQTLTPVSNGNAYLQIRYNGSAAVDKAYILSVPVTVSGL